MTRDIYRGDIVVGAGVCSIPGIGNMPDNGRETPPGYYVQKIDGNSADQPTQAETAAPKGKKSRVRAGSQPGR